jgi:histidinol-phosphate aminotransferase
MLMKNLTLKRIQRIKPYQPPIEGRGKYKGILLDFNERIRPVQNKVTASLEKFLRSQKLQLYPEYFGLEKKIADYVGVKADQIMITNGSDQGIDIVFRTFTEKGDKVIIPRPSFAMFFQRAQIIGNEIVSPFYRKDDLAFPLEKVLEGIEKRTKLVVVGNPNNPTGTAVPLADIEKIARKAKRAIVYVDETYFEFSKITAVPLINKYPNIIVGRTFSKAFGLASLRIGYLIAKAEYIFEMRKVLGPYDVNMAAFYATWAALEDRKDMESYVEEVMKKAKPLVEKFFSENGIPYFPSQANFILFRPKNPEKTRNLLARNEVLVRLVNQQNIENMLRVTIGPKKEMEKFIEIYKKAVLKNS